MPKAGWDGPLKVRYNMRLPELMSAIRRHTPVGGHEHDRLNLLRYSKSGYPRSGGALLREVSRLGNYKAPRGENRVEITLDLPYANIIDAGGTVGPVAGRKMLFNADGFDAMPTARVGFTIKGQGYIRKGFEEWVELPVSKGIKPEWSND